MSDRLRELGDAGVVAHTGSGYSLTPSGHDLLARQASGYAAGVGSFTGSRAAGWRRAAR